METNHDDLTPEQVSTCYDIVMDSLYCLQRKHGEDIAEALGQSVGSVIDALITVRNMYVDE